MRLFFFHFELFKRFDVSVHEVKRLLVFLSFWYLRSFPFINKPEQDKRRSVEASGLEDCVPFLFYWLNVLVGESVPHGCCGVQMFCLQLFE